MGFEKYVEELKDFMINFNQAEETANNGVKVAQSKKRTNVNM